MDFDVREKKVPQPWVHWKLFSTVKVHRFYINNISCLILKRETIYGYEGRILNRKGLVI